MTLHKLQVVAFLGPKASYTHQAALNHFAGEEYDITPQTTIEDVFAAIQDGSAAYGVVPFENSSNGSVVFTLDLFADLHGKYPDILVCSEEYLEVHHCLLGHAPPASHRLAQPWRHLDESPTSSGRATPTLATPTPGKPRVKPLVDVDHITKLYSHPQAWGQCKAFLSTYLKGVERQDVSSTSRAAELVATHTSGTSAAISSRIAAEMNGLDILAEGIEDNEGNSTRFFIIRKQGFTLDGHMIAPNKTATNGDESIEMQQFKSLVYFTVNNENSGALADSLAVFKKHDLNLTSINARPSGEAPWHYIFFVEFVGRKHSDCEGGAVNEALSELDAVATNHRWVGSWKNALIE